MADPAQPNEEGRSGHASGLRVGFIGLGDQGAPMARAISANGWQTLVWARRKESLEAMRGVSHTVCETLSELAAQSDIAALCVRDDRDVEEILIAGGLIDNMSPGAVIVNHGTGAPNRCREWADMGKARRVAVIDAPVSGGRERAERGELTVMVGGDRDAYIRCEPVFRSFAATVSYLGPAGSGQMAKLTNNLMLAANLKNAEDLIPIISAVRMDVRATIDVILAGSGSSFALDAIAHRMPQDLSAHYQAMIGKDLAHFGDVAREMGLPVSSLEKTAHLGVDGLVSAIEAYSDACDGKVA